VSDKKNDDKKITPKFINIHIKITKKNQRQKHKKYPKNQSWCDV